MTDYQIGSIAPLRARWTLNDADTDPDEVTLVITDPGGNVNTLTYTGGDITKDSVGNYHYDQDLTGATPGQWSAVYSATGTVQDSFTIIFFVLADAVSDLVSRIRDEFGDYPELTYVADDPLLAGATSMSLVPGDGAIFPSPRVWFEFDDASGEIGVSTGAGDTSVDTVPFMGAQRGTTAHDHALNTAVLLTPRFARLRIVRNIRQIVDVQLWPHVWVLGEDVIPYNPAILSYPAPTPNIAELVASYQIIQGVNVPLFGRYDPPEVTDATDYPNGVITFPWSGDTSPIFIAYRMRPTLSNLDAELSSLVVLGASARLQMAEEFQLVNPDYSVIQGRQTEGSRSRAGLIAWQAFIDARSQLNITLQQLENTRRVPVRSAGI